MDAAVDQRGINLGFLVGVAGRYRAAAERLLEMLERRRQPLREQRQKQPAGHAQLGFGNPGDGGVVGFHICESTSAAASVRRGRLSVISGLKNAVASQAAMQIPHEKTMTIRVQPRFSALEPRAWRASCMTATAT